MDHTNKVTVLTQYKQNTYSYRRQISLEIPKTKSKLKNAEMLTLCQ